MAELLWHFFPLSMKKTWCVDVLFLFKYSCMFRRLESSCLASSDWELVTAEDTGLSSRNICAWSEIKVVVSRILLGISPRRTASEGLAGIIVDLMHGPSRTDIPFPISRILRVRFEARGFFLRSASSAFTIGWIPKTAIIILLGVFEFLFMLLGLRNAAKTFLLFIVVVLKELDFCFVCIDDILVASSSEEERRKRILQTHSTHVRYNFFFLTYSR